MSYTPRPGTLRLTHPRLNASSDKDSVNGAAGADLNAVSISPPAEPRDIRRIYTKQRRLPNRRRQGTLKILCYRLYVAHTYERSPPVYHPSSCHLPLRTLRNGHYGVRFSWRPCSGGRSGCLPNLRGFVSSAEEVGSQLRRLSVRSTLSESAVSTRTLTSPRECKWLIDTREVSRSSCGRAQGAPVDELENVMACSH